MGDAIVENPATQVLPHRKHMQSSIPNIDSLEGLGTDGSDEYSTLKKLERHMEWVEFEMAQMGCGWTIADTSSFRKNTSRMNSGTSSTYVFDMELKLILHRSLKRELVRAQEEIKRIQSVPLVIGQFMEAIDQKWEEHLNLYG
jgi:26S proteasome regulatory subunit T3